ncbi:PA2778 family cysteine peptidase [Litchfieldella xinjiangensis]|uniref:PA2778 family cysteine peptidase n=1 Tax=Litchfieldella xinjiangensis TaxID=1166948 RepID=UPI0005B8DB9F|nr:PA2778 family cysteine peptidase [Halomonas xinjiangensis]
MPSNLNHLLQQNARLAGVLLFILALGLISGCASGPRLASPAEMGVTEQVKLDHVPFHGQRDYQCGPASLAMALNASGVDVDVDTLIPQVYLPGREGSLQPEMLATLRRYERIGFVIDGRFETLFQELDAGHPVVVMQNLSLPAWPMWHYAVAIGYDLEDEVMIVHSGMEPARLESFKRFDSTWARSGYWAFVALPPGELPVSIGPSRAMDAIAAFEHAQGTEASLPAWQATVSRWPQHAMAWFALGNAQHANGDATAAAESFEKATDEDPTLTVAWLNLGLTLEGLGEIQRARQALQQAASASGQWQETARQALIRLDG